MKTTKKQDMNLAFNIMKAGESEKSIEEEIEYISYFAKVSEDEAGDFLTDKYNKILDDMGN